MLGLSQLLTLAGGLMAILGRNVKIIKTVGAIICITGATGQLVWVANDMWDYFHDDEEEPI